MQASFSVRQTIQYRLCPRCLYVGNEFRTIGLSLEAVLQIPRSEKTRYHEGRFETLSYVRFWSYVGLRLLRAGIALALLYAGILWLGGTKAIEDLILNAVAARL